MNDKILSRELAAGYNKAILDTSVVSVVGAGALGQNVVTYLAQSQVGSVIVTDYDQWEPHNATRSICYPTDAERKQWGTNKAAVVAHKVKKIVHWSNRPRIHYAAKPIQALGDAPFRRASVVVSAVDNRAARDYVGFKTAQFGVPLVEGGFAGAQMNATILLNDTPESPCWHCNSYVQEYRNRAVQLGCSRVAREVEEAGFVPAIPSASAQLAALMTEATIQTVHDNTELGNRQVFMNIRSATASVAELLFNPQCPRHPTRRKVDFSVKLPPDATCRTLLAELEQHLPKPIIQLPFSFVSRVGCAECKQPISVNEPDWIMANLLFCRDCGGKWERTNEPGHEIYTTLSADIEPLLDLPSEKVGLVPGSLIEVENDTQDSVCELTTDSELPLFTQV